VKLDGARVLVTGASRGIGEHVARELARRGAELAIAARGEAELERVAASIEDGGARRPRVVAADVAREADVRQMVAAAERVLGGLDVLVNNAGLGLSGPVREIAPEDLRYVLEVNTVAPLVATQAALLGMLRRRRGRIVNVASVASHMATPGLGGYAATKFALRAWGDVLRMELQGTGVGVTMVYPGPIRTEFVAHVKGRRGEHVPETPFGASVVSCARSIVSAIAGDRDEVFVPAYWQGAVGANNLAPQVLRLFGRRGSRMVATAVDSIGRRRSGRSG
jgi:short-subunit dehydrogenase